jgi:AAA ATPase domain
MRISHLHIPDWKHFQNFDLDLRYPADYKDPSKRGKPLDRVCFIGRNGTGKTSILDLLKFTIEENLKRVVPKKYTTDLPLVSVDCLFSSGEKFTQSFSVDTKQRMFVPYEVVEEQIYVKNKLVHHHLVSLNGDLNFEHVPLAELVDYYENKEKKDFEWVDKRNIENPFETQFPVFSSFNMRMLSEAMRRRFIRRSFLFQKYAERNQQKTYLELNNWLDEFCPPFLSEIAALWNQILAPAKLFLDIDNTKVPEVGDQSFRFVIKHSKSGQEVNLEELSTGMREFMLKIASIFLYYQERMEHPKNEAFLKNGESTTIPSPFFSLFMDEPENGLFVDMLYNYFDNYLNFITPENTQLFVATHSPIIASQFEPEERVILYFDEDGNVRAKRGSAPIGDDVNDMMMRDFETEVFERQKDEIAAWQEYSKILLELPTVQDAVLRKQLIKRYLYLANLYHYPAKKADLEARSAEK